MFSLDVTIGCHVSFLAKDEQTPKPYRLIWLGGCQFRKHETMRLHSVFQTKVAFFTRRF